MRTRRTAGAPSRARRAPTRAKAAPPRAYHHGDLREALVATARKLVERHGVEGFSLRDCARAAGVSHGAPAHHFKDKADLLTRLAVAAFEERLARAEAAIASAGPDPLDRLKACGLAHIGFLIEHPKLHDLCARDGLVDRADPALLDVTRRMTAGLVALMQDVTGQTLLPDKEANPSTLLALVVVNGFAGLVNDRVILAGAKPDERPALARAMASQLLDMLSTAFKGRDDVSA